MAQWVWLVRSTSAGLPGLHLLALVTARATGFAALELPAHLLRLMVGLSCFLIALERVSEMDLERDAGL